MDAPVINNIELVNTRGLEAVTLFNGKPYFFLMCDIDSKDPEKLISILKYFQKWHYSVFYYETTKGYHIISPILLTLRTWAFRLETLRHLIKGYRFVALRISRRSNESNICHYKSWNDKKFKESESIHLLMNELFSMLYHNAPKKLKLTQLFFINYDQLNYSIDGANNSSTISLDRCSNSCEDVNQHIKSNETLTETILRFRQ